MAVSVRFPGIAEALAYHLTHCLARARQPVRSGKPVNWRRVRQMQKLADERMALYLKAGRQLLSRQELNRLANINDELRKLSLRQGREGCASIFCCGHE